MKALRRHLQDDESEEYRHRGGGDGFVLAVTVGMVFVRRPPAARTPMRPTKFEKPSVSEWKPSLRMLIAPLGSRTDFRNRHSQVQEQHATRTRETSACRSPGTIRPRTFAPSAPATTGAALADDVLLRHQAQWRLSELLLRWSPMTK
jgi:hypothetical protein